MKITKRIISAILALAIFWGLCSSGAFALSIHAVPAEHVHIWNDGEVTKEPTCTEPGEKTYTCTDPDCGGTKTETLPAAHTLDHVAEVPAKLGGKGSKEHWVCSVCGKKFLDVEGKTEVTDPTQLETPVREYSIPEESSTNFKWLSDPDVEIVDSKNGGSGIKTTKNGLYNTADNSGNLVLYDGSSTLNTSSNYWSKTGTTAPTKGLGVHPQSGKAGYTLISLNGLHVDTFYSAAGFTVQKNTPNGLLFTVKVMKGDEVLSSVSSEEIHQGNSAEFSVSIPSDATHLRLEVAQAVGYGSQSSVWAYACVYCAHSHTREELVAEAASCTKGKIVNVICDTCGATVKKNYEVPGSTLPHTLDHVAEVPAKLGGKGTKEHWVCSVCGKKFLDAEGKTEVTDPAQLETPVREYSIPEESSTNFKWLSDPDVEIVDSKNGGSGIKTTKNGLYNTADNSGNLVLYDGSSTLNTSSNYWSKTGTTAPTKGLGVHPQNGKAGYTLISLNGLHVDTFYSAAGFTVQKNTPNGLLFTVKVMKGDEVLSSVSSEEIHQGNSAEFSVSIPSDATHLRLEVAQAVGYGSQSSVWAYACVYCAHSHTSEVEVQAAACTTNRTVKTVCDTCGTTIVEEHEVPDTALGHTLEYHEAKAATPEAPGNLAYWYCTVCKRYYLDEQCTQETTAEGVVVEYEPCDHTWDDGKVTKEPTCKEEGEKTFTCSACDETKIEKIPMIAHTLTHVPAVEPTMLTEGTREHYKCAVCGKCFVDETGTTEVTAAELTIPKLPIAATDNYTNNTDGVYWTPGSVTYLSDLPFTSAMPPKAGTTELRTATVDTNFGGKTIAIGAGKVTFAKGLGTLPYEPNRGENYIIVDIRTQKANRFYAATGITGSAATPGNGNYEKYGVNYFVLGSKDGVNYELLACSGRVWKQESGEFSVDITGYGWLKLITACSGLHNYGCDNVWANACVYCTHPEMEHHAAVEATPEADGNLEYWYCPACGKYYLDEEGTRETTAEEVVVKYQAHVHTWDDGVVTKEPTCTEPGEKTYTCTDPDCGEIKTEEIPATGHNLTHAPAVAPTTQQEGNLEHWRCTACGKYYLDADGKEETTAEKVTLPKRPKAVNFNPSATGTFTTALPDAALYPDADLDKSPFAYDSYNALTSNPKVIVNSTVKIGVDQVTYTKGFKINPAAPSAEKQAYVIINVGNLDVNRFYSGVGITGSASNPNHTSGNYGKYGVVFYVYGSKDGEHYEQLACSGDIFRRESGEFNVDITGYSWLKLSVICAASQNWGCESTWVNACLYKYEEGHVHTLEKVDRVEPTMLTEGTREHYKCACGKIFADAEGKQELTAADLVLEKLAIAASNYTVNTDGIYMSAPGSVIFLSDLPFDSAMPPKNGTPRPAAKDTAFGGSTILIGAGKAAFSKGFGTLPAENGASMNYILVDISGKDADRFYAATGITGSAATPSSGNYGKYGVVYFVLGSKDGIHYEQLACSGTVMKQESGEFSVDITGYKWLKLVTACAGAHNYGCDSAWANACIYNSKTTDLKPALQENAYAPVDAPTGINPKNGTLTWLSDLTYESCKNNNSAEKRTVSDAQYGTDSAALTIGNKKTFQKGLGVHPNGETVYDLSGLAVDTLYAVVGITNPKGRDGASEGVLFSVYADYGDGIYQLIAKSDVILNKNTGEFRVDIKGVQKLKLVVAAKGSVTSSASAWAGACVYQADPNAALSTKELLKTETPKSPQINFDPAKNFTPIQDGNYMKLPNSVSYLSDLDAEALKSYATPDSKGNARGAKRDVNWSGGSSIWLGNCSVSFTKGLSIVPSPDGKPDAYILADISGLEGNWFYAAVGITGSAATENHANFGECGIVCYIYGSKDKTTSTNPADYDLLACSGALLMRESGEFNLNVTGYQTLLLVTDTTHKNNYGCDMFWANAAVYQPEGAAEPFKGSRFKPDAFTANSGTFAGMAFPAKGDVIYLSGIPYLESSNSLSDAYPAGDPTALNHPFGATSGSGFTLGSGNTKFNTGLGMYPKDPARPVNGSINSWTIYDLSEINVTHFYAAVGLTDKSSDGAGVIFRVFGDYSGMGDYMLLAQSDALKGDATGEFNLKITGIKHLMLVVVSAGDSNASCAAAWADACVYTANEEDPQKPTQPEDPKDPSAPAPTQENPKTDSDNTGFPWVLIYIAVIAVCGGIGAGVAWLVKRKKKS